MTNVVKELLLDLAEELIEYRTRWINKSDECRKLEVALKQAQEEADKYKPNFGRRVTVNPDPAAGVTSIAERDYQALQGGAPPDAKGGAFRFGYSEGIGAFANWLDSMGINHETTTAQARPHGFAELAEKFINSIPVRNGK